VIKYTQVEETMMNFTRKAVPWLLAFLLSAGNVMPVLPAGPAGHDDGDCGCPGDCPCRGSSGCCACAKSAGRLSLKPACRCGKDGEKSGFTLQTWEGLAVRKTSLSLPEPVKTAFPSVSRLPNWLLAYEKAHPS
jgi:hypothetical protein